MFILLRSQLTTLQAVLTETPARTATSFMRTLIRALLSTHRRAPPCDEALERTDGTACTGASDSRRS